MCCANLRSSAARLCVRKYWRPVRGPEPDPLLHACTLGDGCFVGMGATVMDFAVVEPGAMVGAGSLVLNNAVVKTGELWAGRPAKYKRDLKDAEKAFLQKSAKQYAQFAQRHKESSKKLS